MKFKSILITYLVLHILLIINGKLTPNIYWNCVGAFLVCFCLTIYCIKKFGNNKPTWKLLLTLVLVRLLLLGGYDLYVHLSEELYGSPVLTIHLLGIISGFFYLKLKRPFNLMPLAFSSVFVLFIFFLGWDLYAHKRAYQTFTGRVEAYSLPAKFEARDEQNNLVADDNFKNKIVLLDFWYTGCGVCFQKFPQLEAIYNKYKNDSSVVILAVNKPIEEDKPNEAFQVIKTEGFSFPVVITKDEDLAERFGVRVYPTTFVINQNGQIIYKGGIEGAVKMVDLLKER